MLTQLYEPEMRKLQVVEIRSMPKEMDELNRQDLCAHRGIDLGPVVAGERYFVDRDFGYLIANRDFVQKLPMKLHQADYPSVDNDRIHENWRAALIETATKNECKEQYLPWYVKRSGGWPSLRGSCVRVGIIDDGNWPRLLKRGAADFGTCHGIGMKPWSIGKHGEDCAKAIAEADSGGKRWSPAPDCRIVSGQATRPNSEAYMWFVDLLLMLSWTVGCRDAQIVNMSFTLDTKEITTKSKRILSNIACNLRDQNRALIFASTDDRNKVVGYPAGLDGITAVNGYSRAGENGISANIGTDPSWQEKIEAQDLLFAPNGVCLSETDGFGGTSSSCAYASGVAALYVERYLDQPKQGGGSYTLSDIRSMLGESLGSENELENGVALQGIKLHP